ncbi:beta-lactamase family protein [Niabella sp. CC-SYL272]|uniref:serine hydrolase domain-containing protein n=1 Tax=Niabella agricola TaxID=2891571 RepID=UPI001F389A7B|nr:serine hydrolase domain-containing protein [Niabella agricola]MCF3112023.1 beta-lactamase family protein [Niabella agricola]
MNRSLYFILPLLAGFFLSAYHLSPPHALLAQQVYSIPGEKIIPAADSIKDRRIPEMAIQQLKNFPEKTQFSIAVIQSGKISFFGLLKEKDSILEINNSTAIFEIGSITKVFTAAVLADLVIRKKIKLEDFINTYYPFPFHQNIQLNFKSLSNHTSGLPRLPANFAAAKTAPLNPYKNYGARQLEDYLKNELSLQQPTGARYEYSNLGAGLLGYTLGRSQKTTFPDLLKKTVLDKYQMRHSYIRPEQAGPQLVKGLNEKGDEVPNWEFDALFGGGGLLSCTKDLALFAMAQFDASNKELALTRVPTFTVSDRMQMGLGWHIISTNYGRQLYWHNGGTGGYSSSMAINASSGNAVILLSNVSAFHPQKDRIDQLCFNLARLIAKKTEAAAP